MELFLNLGIALTVGLLIGIERGWHTRAVAEGSRIAGIRTFGLIGLLGGLSALLATEFGNIFLGLAFLSVSLLMTISKMAERRSDTDFGITTIVAGLVSFALGALAMSGYQTVAAAAAVVTAALLSLKPVLHEWLLHLEKRELYAAIKLLLISVVLLPVLPNQGYGPWASLNPYEIWWFVVLIAGISFAGYFAMKIAGTRRGILLTGVFGGLVSSTAVTLSFSRLGRDHGLHQILAAGVLVSAGTMFPRMLLEVAVVNPNLLPSIAVPLSLMTVIMYGVAAWLWRRQSAKMEPAEFPMRNPFELSTAIQIGLFLGVIMLLAEALRSWMGDMGIYILSAIAGLTDVDAITLSMARLARVDLSTEVASHAIILAAIVNTLVKTLMVFVIAGKSMGLKVSLATFPAVLAGVVGLLLLS